MLQRWGLNRMDYCLLTRLQAWISFRERSWHIESMIRVISKMETGTDMGGCNDHAQLRFS